MPRRTKRLSTLGDCLLEPENEDTEVATNTQPKEGEQQRRKIRMSARRSISGRRSTANFDLQINQIYTDCIQLGTKNKINQSNAWKAKLVDVMDKILLNDERSKEKTKQSSSKVCNFQVASNTLDTSVKIYSYRVDSVHNDTYRVLSGLNRSTKQKEPTNESEGEGGDQNAEKTKKRKVMSLTHTLDSISNLNAKRLDMEFAVDPLFHKTAAAFDEGGAKGLLLSQLGISKGCNVVFDSTEYHPENIIVSNETYDASELFGLVNPEWETTELCPFFQDFSFVSPDSDDTPLSQNLPNLDETEENDQESFEDYSSSFEILSQRDDFAVPPEIETVRASSMAPGDSPEHLATQISEMSIEPVGDLPEYEDYASQDNFVSQEPYESDSQPESQIEPQPEDAISQMLEGRSNVPSIDFIKNLVSDTTEYNYFNNALMSNWAGPEHWKFKQTKNQPLRQNDGDEGEKETTTKPRRKKKDFFLDFFAEDETDYETLFAPSKRGGTISKEAMMNSTKPTTLPFVDVHYDIKRFTQLFSKPGKIISFQFESNERFPCTENSQASQELSFENDMGSNIPTSYEEDDDDMGSFGGWMDNSQDHFEFGSQISSQLSDVLVDEPEKVRNIKISYARRAKRVDIEKLKNSIWTELCVSAEQSENQSPNTAASRVINSDVCDVKTFSEVLTSLPNSVPAAQMTDLSVPLCFICLLDLANKKGLQIDQQNDDLSIAKYNK